MRMRIAFSGTALCLCLAPMVMAQDAVKADPKHYSVMSENEQVRILKVHYGAHEKSIMHSHPDAVAVFLNDANVHFSYPDGKSEDRSVKAGDAQFTPHTVHLPENAGDSGMDVIVIEMKGKMAKSMPQDHMEKMEKK